MAGEQLTLDGLPRARKPRPKKKPGGGHWQRETSEQIKIGNWARKHTMEYPALTWLHHIPNGGGRTPREAAVLKRAGVTKGIPDLSFPYPSPLPRPLYRT